MTPFPPIAHTATTWSSFPEYISKSSLAVRAAIFAIWEIFPEASFTATIFFTSFASLYIVSGSIFIPVLPAIL